MLGTPLGEASIKLGSIKLPLRRMLRHSRHCGYGSVVMEYWIPLGKKRWICPWTITQRAGWETKDVM